MLLYVINVDSCIHMENYRIFFYEPVAKKKLELFEASWTPDSLTGAFREVAQHINRRGFESQDYQVLVCVRRRENERWKETTLYARAMVSQALEQSESVLVITGAFTRKVTVLFQVEQPYYGTAPRTSVWEEETGGLACFLDILEADSFFDAESGAAKHAAAGRTDRDLKTNAVQAWEDALAKALEQPPDRTRGDGVTRYLKERLSAVLEQEKNEVREGTLREEEVPDCFVPQEEEEAEEEDYDYISHRLRSLLDGSGLNLSVEVIYWPVPRESSRANRVSMLSLTDLLRSGAEITREQVSACFSEQHPDYEKRLLERYRLALSGYRLQLLEKKERILQEIADSGGAEEMSEEAASLSLSLPEPSFSLTERIEAAGQQLENCAFSLKKSKRSEVEERINDISQSLLAAFDGLERELLAYEAEVTDCLYREIEGDGHAGFEAEPESAFGTNPFSGIKKVQKDADGGRYRKTEQENRGESDEEAAKRMISQWRQDMQLLTGCARLTGLSAAVGYLAAVMAAAFVPYLLTQGEILAKKESLPAALVIWGGMLLFLIVKRGMMPAYFIRSISKSYQELQEKLSGVLKCYGGRAADFRDEIDRWLQQEKKLQKQRTDLRRERETAELSARRAWHLANLQRTADRLETFHAMEEAWPGTEMQPEAARRVLQPMDYAGKEPENEVYWPVIEPSGREEETDE